MSNNLVVEQRALAKKANDVRDLLEKYKVELSQALPKHMIITRLLRVVINALTVNPELLKCDQVSLLRAIFQSAILGLEPNTHIGESYLVPYENRRKGITEVQLIPGYQGLMKLARNSGEIASIESRAVYENDEFEYSLGLNPVLVHKPIMAGDPGKLYAAYCIVYFKDQEQRPYIEVMNRAEIEKIKKSSKAAQSSYSPWNTFESEMWRKTAVRRACKYIPRSIELNQALSLSDQADAGENQLLDDKVLNLLPEETSENVNFETGEIASGEESDAPTPPAGLGDDDMAPGDPKNHQDIKGKTDELPLGNSKKKGSGDF
jgi:recombination protein RecT